MTCVFTMVWSVFNSFIGFRGTIYCKVYLLSSYLALWTIVIICWNTRGVSLQDAIMIRQVEDTKKKLKQGKGASSTSTTPKKKEKDYAINKSVAFDSDEEKDEHQETQHTEAEETD